MSARLSFTEGWKGDRTEHRDQYIISYKLNSTEIDPEGVCERLRTVDECTVNPTDQCGEVERREVEEGWGGSSRRCLHMGRRHEELGLEGVIESSEYGA